MKILVFLTTLMTFTSIALATPEANEPAECKDAMTTIQMNACANAYYERADFSLNMAWTGIRACYAVAEANEAWKMIVQEQKNWIKFRDSFCENLATKDWGTGTGWTLGYVGCKTQETESRAQYLMNFHKQVSCDESEPGEM